MFDLCTCYALSIRQFFKKTGNYSGEVRTGKNSATDFTDKKKLFWLFFRMNFILLSVNICVNKRSGGICG